jgi:hypothetical protein
MIARMVKSTMLIQRSRDMKQFRTNVTRRKFLQAGLLGAGGLTCAEPLLVPARANTALPANGADDRACIMIFNTGGPSHLDLFDMKPNAPAEIRGPFNPIKTKVPGLHLSELLPLHAEIADKFSLVRSCYHTAPAVHDTGHQLMQTGRLFANGLNSPHAGCALAYLNGHRNDLPAHVLMPKPIGFTGANLSHGQDAGLLGQAFDPFALDTFTMPTESATSNWLNGISNHQVRTAFDLSQETDNVRDRYGRHRFGESCLRARRLIEAGVRFVTLNTFHTVFDEITWDIHGTAPFTTIEQMRNDVAPMYDQGYNALITDLSERGMLDKTLVCNLAEFGRTPRINPHGGRDHWTQCWTVYFAGGGVQGGRIVGRSDAIGATPVERPVEPAEVVATIYHSLGLDLNAVLPGPPGNTYPLVDAGKQPILELF